MIVKYKMKSKQKYFIGLFIVAIVMPVLVGCQPTPQTGIITKKDQRYLDDSSNAIGLGAAVYGCACGM
jgi:H+/gluconate symporter-like permease